MTPIELFQEGRLREAIQVQDRFVHSSRDDSAARLLLCEFLLFDGNIASIRNHLDILPRDIPGMDDYLSGYRLLLDAELDRRQILSTNANQYPRFLLEPSRHMTERIKALDAYRRGDFAVCFEFLDNADSLLPDIIGHVDGREFDMARDGDDLFAHHLEVLIEGHYAWFPFDQIDLLRLGPIETLRDRLYVPALLRARTGDEWQVHLPALYPNTHLHNDEEVKTGQATDWFAEAEGPTRGVGLRVITFGEEELTLLDFTHWEG